MRAERGCEGQARERRRSSRWWAGREVRDDVHGLEDGHRDEPDGAAALEREASDVLGLGEPVGQHQLAVETHRGVEPGQQGPGGLGAAREGQRRLGTALFVHDDSDEPAAPSSGPDAAGE